MAETPETSDYTSVKRRTESLLASVEVKAEANTIKTTTPSQPKAILRFVGNPRQAMLKGLPFDLLSYLELVELTGRVVREDKRGAISHLQLPILERLNIQLDNWLTLTTQFGKRFHGAVGEADVLKNYCTHLKLKRRPNIANNR